MTGYSDQSAQTPTHILTYDPTNSYWMPRALYQAWKKIEGTTSPQKKIISQLENKVQNRQYLAGTNENPEGM